MKNRNLVIGTAITLLAIFVAVGLYLGFFKNSNKIQPLPSPSPLSTVSLPSPQASISQNFNILDNGWALSATIHALGSDNRVLYFEHNSGELRSSPLFPGVKPYTLSKASFAGIFDVLWPASGTKILFDYLKPSGNPAFAVYDYQTSTSTILDPSIESVIWSPDGTKLLIHKVDPSANINYLATILPNGTKETRIADLGFLRADLAWPNSNIIFAAEKPVPGIQGQLLEINPKTKQPQKLFSAPGEGEADYIKQAALSSPDGKKILVNTVDGGGTELPPQIFDTTSGAVIASLPNRTLVNKCAWTNDSQNLYCAFPDNVQLSSAVDMPFAYWRGEVVTNDSFGKFDLKSGAITWYQKNTGFDANSVSIAPTEDYLTFINRFDHSLYSLKL